MEEKLNSYLKELNRLNVQIVHMRRCVLDTSWKHSNSKAHFTRIYLPIWGEGQICCDGSRNVVVPGNVYIIPADSEFSYFCEELLEKIFIHVSIPRFDRYDLFHDCKGCIVFPDTKEYLKSFLKCHDSRELSDMLQLKGLIYEIIADAIAVSKSTLLSSAVYSSLTTRALTYISENVSAQLTLEQICAGLNCSSSTLQKQFRKEMGISIGRYLKDRVLMVAADRLCSTELSIQRISDELGFCDQFHFSKKFTARYGMSPSVYRKTFLLNQVSHMVR